nr:putative colanic acid biosynthesis acetyltransferase [Burkholderia sp. MSMB1589WGS]
MILQDNDPFTGPSFSYRHRVLRQAWSIVYVTLFRPSPRPFHAWRALLLRMFGAKLGTHVHIYPGARIWAPWNLEIGDKVGVADRVNIYNMDKIRIGNHCVISDGAYLCGGSHQYNMANFQLCAEPITLEDNVWICAEAFVHLGVRISEGVVVGARAVVTKTIDEPWSVYAGTPCKRVGKRTRITQSQ